ncbi:MAG: hypothetical protein R3272_13645 [Candidatus Promineifilaceae bacterium]|nr:hypothetical protein [Candidatus Promineifilaceae bacterium]
MTKCTATTAAGNPCRAHAVRGSDPPLCSIHSGRVVEGRRGNQNARTHGFYAHTLDAQELADLVAYAGDETLEDEIAVNRVLLRRLMEYLARVQEAEGELSRADLATIGPLILRSTHNIARLLRDRRALSGDSADGLMGAIGQALDELSTEWGIEL